MIMNIARRFILIWLLTAAAALADAPVASVNGVTIQQSVLAEEIARLQSQGIDVGVLPGNALIHQLIARELMWQKACAAGFSGQTDCAHPVIASDRHAAIDAYVSRRLPPAVPEEEAVRARYDEVVSRLGAREFRLSIIRLRDPDALRSLAKAVSDSSDFARAAHAHSRAPSAARGGELGWVSFPEPVTAGRTNGLPLAVAQSVSAMQIGQVSDVIRIEEDWLVVRLDGVRDTLVPDYASVRDLLRDALGRQSAQLRSRQLLLEVLRDAHIRIVD
ncbi:MAG: peptidyl-prolyl cis-trans isomerase [Methyloversatilis sp.]|nr:peptidyl-prolyl cis-trans isomerase [Methyloversatilis sp.]MBP6195565.1 peptidyl-prolyl cis-trans isomerase [Methyloversatilis sp.]